MHLRTILVAHGKNPFKVKVYLNNKIDFHYFKSVCHSVCLTKTEVTPYDSKLLTLRNNGGIYK